jgi:chromate transporter
MTPHTGPSLRDLFLSFLRLGATAFGGPSMVVYIQRLAVDRKRWLDEKTFVDGVALCQAIPGATAMQTAAYVGLRARGAAGAGASFAGFGLPAFLLMTSLSILYRHTHDLPSVIATFSGLQAITVAIVAYATVVFGRAGLKTWTNRLIMAGAAVLFLDRVHPITVILLAALAGFVFVRPGVAPGPAADDRPRIPFPARAFLIILTSAAAGAILLAVFRPDLLRLAALMMKIDLFAFGGAFASVPLMYHEIVGVHRWMDGPTFLNGIVLGQVTPGPIVITATFAGYWMGGLLGAVVAAVAIFLPSFSMVIGLAPYFDRLRTSPYFGKVTTGVLCSFVGLLLSVTAHFSSNVQWDPAHALIAGAAFAALLARVDILWVVVAGAIVSALAL